jgi:hypothetical protein
MRYGMAAVALALALRIAGCTENTAPGNDREAALAASEPPARMGRAGTVIQGVATGLLKPEIMTEADLTNVPDAADQCMFRMTRVGFPVLVYGSTGVMKLNGRLVSLPSRGDGRYSEDDVAVTVRSLDEESGQGSQFAAELVLRLPGAPHELGFHGYSECPGGEASQL